jgi:hypothetical protein
VRALVVLGLCALVAGCSDDEPPSPSAPFAADQNCGLRAEITGSVTASLSGKQHEVNCIFGLPRIGVRTEFLPNEGELAAFNLRVDEVGQGVTGSNFPADVSLQTRADSWTSYFCAVDVAEHRPLGPEDTGSAFRLVGSGRCTPSAGSESVKLDRFDFVTIVNW